MTARQTGSRSVDPPTTAGLIGLALEGQSQIMHPQIEMLAKRFDSGDKFSEPHYRSQIQRIPNFEVLKTYRDSRAGTLLIVFASIRNDYRMTLQVKRYTL